jgi:DNA-binding response OmpR family regulator
MRGKILIVEDDPLIADMVKRYLQREGFTVSWVSSGREAVEYVKSLEPDVIILDLMLPDADGFELCKRFSEGSCLILILSAKDADEDRIVGLEIGADDYMTKPFNMRELIARVKALLRRKEKGASADVIREGRLEIRLSEMRAYVDGNPIELTPKELLILKKLLLNRGRVVSRSAIASELYTRELPEYERIVDTYIYRIRTKLMEFDKELSKRIKTVRGFGYKFE